MMDATPLFPRGFHPISDNTLPDNVMKYAPQRPRAITPVKYYYTDFGLSSRFSAHETSRLVTGRAGLDGDVPELSHTDPYDPFKVDIFILGSLFRKLFFEVGIFLHV